MRLFTMSLLVTAGSLAACAGPADPSAASTPAVYRTGSLLRQPNVPQPDLSYYGQDELSRSPDGTLRGALAHSPATLVPPPAEPPSE